MVDDVAQVEPLVKLSARERTLAVFEALTVGGPFCAFKVLCGQHLGGALGWALVALGAVDLLLNAVNALWLLALGRRVAPICLFHGVARAISAAAADVGTALDTVLSFALVAAMIGFSQLKLLPPEALATWNAAVVLNVLGAGVLRLAQALPAR